MNVNLDCDSVLTTDPGTIEGPALPDLRWRVYSTSTGYAHKVLQQAVRMQRGEEYWVEWRDVPEVMEDAP